MGLLILDSIKTPVGLNLSNLIVCAKGGFHLIPRNTPKGKIYELNARLYYYVRRDCASLFEETLNLKVPVAELRDPYRHIYDHLKKKYPNSVEC